MPRDQTVVDSLPDHLGLQPHCRSCHSNRVKRVGSLPKTWRFAGHPQPQGLPGGFLFRCSECGLAFRFPLLASDTYARLYREGSTELWNGEAGHRQDFELVRAYIAGLGAGQEVLDVGCYTGQLLASLPAGTRLYGVEPNARAAERAALLGVDIVADHFEELAEVDRHFDVITACDVIEHVPDPLQFLRLVRPRLRIGGVLLLTTGNVDAWLWRIVGSRFWYCYFPEHISFIGRRWLGLMPPRAGFIAEQTLAFGNGFRGYSGATVRSLGGAFIYAFAPRAFRRLRAALAGEQSRLDPPPGSGASRDHIFCALRAA